MYDVAWSGDRAADAVTGEVPAKGSTVDVSKATDTNTISATVLKKVWIGPDFDPAQHAFYQYRVFQIPTAMLYSYDAAKLQVPPPAVVSATVQDQTWTTKIWFTPNIEDGKRPAKGNSI